MTLHDRAPTPAVPLRYRGSVPAPPGQVAAPQRATIATLRAEAGLADDEGDPAAAAALRRAADVLARRGGAVVVADRDGLHVRCFGRFRVGLGEAELPLDHLRPRARATLRLLSLHVGRPVHREVLLTALWPEADAAAATRSLQTTVSSVRRLVADATGGDGLVREGQSYVLDEALVATDVRRAEGLLRSAEGARRQQPSAARAGYAEVLDLYAGDLLVEEGPAEWVVEAREDWRRRAAGAAYELAVLEYAAGRSAAAAAAARRGLEIDRLADPLWRVLTAALRADDDPVAADFVVQEYEALLAAL